MKKLLIYQWCLLLLTAFLLGACQSQQKKSIDKRITLSKNDKIPYGAWYAYENLQHVFPTAEIAVNKKALSAYPNGIQPKDKLVLEGKGEAYVIICRAMAPSEEEATALNNFIQNGGQVFISAKYFNSQILDSLKLESEPIDLFNNIQKGVTVNDPVTGKRDSFYYPGFGLEDHFSGFDSSITTILGRNSNGQPNFVEFTYDGGGSLFLHIAPLALSNFFLLHKDNKRYYDEVMSHLKGDVRIVYWDDYFRTHRSTKKDEKFSALGWISQQPALFTALWMIIVLALIVYLFESKRKQRMIPARPALKNATVEFARTVGRLYYQRKDNNNLAWKMTTIFMDNVRRKFNVRTTMDEEFVEKLSHKSGYDKTALGNLVYQLKYAQAHPEVTDIELLELQQLLDHFYQNT